jgi:uncharacterized protein (DUF433 family)
MSAQPGESKTEKIIQHRKGTAGTSAFVGSSRVRVSDIAQLYETLRLEFVAARIQEEIPHLSESEIVAALRYWQGHPDEIAQEIERDEEALRSLQSAG